MPLRTINPAQRRYQLRIGVAMGLYIVFIAVEHRLFDAVAPATRYVLAALPALPVMACFAIMGRYLIEEQDEYVRMQTATQSLWATGIALSGATLWGFLETFGLAPHVPGWFTVPVWALGMALAQLWMKVRGS